MSVRGVKVRGEGAGPGSYRGDVVTSGWPCSVGFCLMFLMESRRKDWTESGPSSGGEQLNRMKLSSCKRQPAARQLPGSVQPGATASSQIHSQACPPVRTCSACLTSSLFTSPREPRKRATKHTRSHQPLTLSHPHTLLRPDSLPSLETLSAPPRWLRLAARLRPSRPLSRRPLSTTPLGRLPLRSPPLLPPTAMAVTARAMVEAPGSAQPLIPAAGLRGAAFARLRATRFESACGRIRIPALSTAVRYATVYTPWRPAGTSKPSA